MKVEIKEREELVREISVEIEPAEVTRKLEAKFEEVRRDVTLKGFRKGHAPMNVIKATFTDDVRADVAEDLLKTTYPEAIRQKDLAVAAQPTVTHLDYTEAGGLTYTAVVEILPVIDKLDLDRLEVSSYDLEVTDDEVNRAAEEIRKMRAEQRSVDREVRPTDIVVVDLKKTFDSKGAIPEDEFSDAVIELSNPVTVTEFKEQMPGLKKGETKEIEVKYGDDYPDAAFAGATIRYETTVKDIREELLPNFDDHLAKSTGQAETALELRLKIREDLKAQKERELRRFNRNEVVQQLVEHNKIPVPAGLVSEYLDAVVEDARRQQPDIDETEVRNAYRGMAESSLRWNLLSSHIARQENIQVTREDTDKVIKRFAENYRITEQQAAEALQRSGKAASVRDTLIEEKVLDFLISKAKVVKREPEPAPTNKD